METFVTRRRPSVMRHQSVAMKVPDLPPVLETSRMSVIRISLSTALHMS